MFPDGPQICPDLVLLVELRRFELLTSCMPVSLGGSTSTHVHPRRSPSPCVPTRPPPSVCVAVLPCCTRPPPAASRGIADSMPFYLLTAAFPRPLPRRNAAGCRCATSLCRPGGLRPPVNRRTSCSVSSLICRMADDADLHSYSVVRMHRPNHKVSESTSSSVARARRSPARCDQCRIRSRGQTRSELPGTVRRFYGERSLMTGACDGPCAPDLNQQDPGGDQADGQPGEGA
jgi:hypothetical protein